MAARHSEKYVDAAVNSATVEIDRAAWADDTVVTIGIEQSLDGGKSWSPIASGTTTAGKRSKASLKCFLPNDDIMGRLVRGFTSVEKGDAPDAPSLVTETARRPAKLSGHHSVGYDADGSNSAVASGLTTITLSSFTIASNSNRALLAFVGLKDAASITVSGITWNTSENLTQFQDDSGTGTRARGWYLVAPTATTANLVATLSADADFVALFAGSFYNVNQSTPLGTSQLNTGSGIPRAEIGCAGDVDGMSVGFVVGFTAAFTTGTVTSRTDVPFYNNIGAGRQSNGATTLSPAAPATRLIGDCEILTVATENNATISVNAAWTRIGTVVQQNSTWQQDLFYRVYDGSEVAPAPSWSGSVGCSAKRANWRNAKASGPIGNINSNSGTGSTHSITGINASANNSRVGYLSHAEANTALGNDADYTERNDAGSGTGPYRIVFGERTQATSGAGAADFSATGANASWVMRLFELLSVAQTLREEIEVNDGTDCLVASMVTEDGDTFNQLCWEFNSNPNTSCIAVSVKPANPVSIQPGQGNLALSTTAPSRVTDERRDPAGANLTLSSTAPTVTQGSAAVSISPAAANLVLSTAAPSAVVDAAMAPAAANLALSSAAPTVAVTAHVSISPAAANLALSTVAPSAVQNAAISPASADPALSTTAPTVARTDHHAASPAAADLSLSTAAPASVQNTALSPTSANIILSAVAPDVARTDHHAASPAARDLSLSTAAPALVVDTILAPAAGDLTLSTTAPTVARTDHHFAAPAAGDLAISAAGPDAVRADHVSLAPAAADLAISAAAPTVQRTANADAQPASGNLALSTSAPAAVQDTRRDPAHVDLAITGSAPTAERTDRHVALPAAGQLSLSTAAPSVSSSAAASLSPAAADLSISTSAPTAARTDDHFRAPAAADLALSPSAPSGIVGVRLDPAASDLSLSTTAPAVEATAHHFAAPEAGNLALTATAPTAAANDNRNISPGAASLTIEGAAPTVTAGAGISISPAAAQVAIEAAAPTVAATEHRDIAPGAAALSLSGAAPAVTVPATGALYIAADAAVTVYVAGDAAAPVTIYAASDAVVTAYVATDAAAPVTVYAANDDVVTTYAAADLLMTG